MNLAYSNIARIARAADLLTVLQAFETDLLLRVSELSRRIFVDAGVVECGGSAMLILGEKGQGKSLLVKALVDSGASYFSDRCAVLDDSGRVFPYPTSLTMGGEAPDAASRVQIPREKTGRRSVPVRGVVICEHRKNATWRPRKLTQGQAIMELLGNAFPARIRPQKTFAALQAVVLQSEVYQCAYGEAVEAAPKLLDLLQGAKRSHPGQ